MKLFLKNANKKKTTAEIKDFLNVVGVPKRSED